MLLESTLFYGPRNCVTNLARPGIMCPFHESSRRSDGSVLDDGKDYMDLAHDSESLNLEDKLLILQELLYGLVSL